MTVPTVTLNDGHTIPQLGFGVFKISTDDVVATVSTALEVGYRHIDAASIYGNEEGVGEAIRRSGIPREDLFITTKLWNDSQAPAAAEQALADSLTRLGLEYVDLYLIHWPVPNNGLYVGAWETLLKLAEKGLTRSVGVSNFNAEHVDAILAATGKAPAVNQIEVHPTFSQPELFAYNTSHGIATQAWGPLGQGRGELDHPTIVAVAQQTGKSPAQVVLRWHLQRGVIAFPKSVTPSRIAENFDVFGFTLTDEQMASIDSVNTGTRGGADPLTFGRM